MPFKTNMSCTIFHSYSRILIALRLRIQPEVTSTVPPQIACSTTMVRLSGSALLKRVSTTSVTSSETADSPRMNASHFNKVLASRNILKTLSIVTVVFIICWFPNKCYAFLYLIGITSTIGQAYYLTLGLALFNCCVNPFIYIARFKAFRAGVFTMFGCRNCEP